MYSDEGQGAFDANAVLAAKSTDPREMLPWTGGSLPNTLIVFELVVGPGLDIRYRRRTSRIPITDEASLKVALANVHNRKHTVFSEPKANSMRSALSVGVRGKLIYALLLDEHQPGQSQLRFSRTSPPFMAGNEQAARHQFSPRNVHVDDDFVSIGAENAPADPASDARMAFFMINLDGATEEQKALPFNINLEVAGRLPPGQGGASYITPIIIDPDLLHPPQGGGIPTEP